MLAGETGAGHLFVGAGLRQGRRLRCALTLLQVLTLLIPSTSPRLVSASRVVEPAGSAGGRRRPGRRLLEAPGNEGRDEHQPGATDLPVLHLTAAGSRSPPPV